MTRGCTSLPFKIYALYDVYMSVWVENGVQSLDGPR